MNRYLFTSFLTKQGRDELSAIKNVTMKKNPQIDQINHWEIINKKSYTSDTLFTIKRKFLEQR